MWVPEKGDIPPEGNAMRGNLFQKLAATRFAENTFSELVFGLIRNVTYAALVLWVGEMTVQMNSHHWANWLTIIIGLLISCLGYVILGIAVLNGWKRVAEHNFTILKFNVFCIIILIVSIAIVCAWLLRLFKVI